MAPCDACRRQCYCENQVEAHEVTVMLSERYHPPAPGGASIQAAEARRRRGGVAVRVCGSSGEAKAASSVARSVASLRSLSIFRPNTSLT